MFKKFAVISGMMITTSVALATSAAPYLGGSLGVNINTSNVKVTSSPTEFQGGSYRGMPFNVFIGYGAVFDQNYYLAGELQGTLGTASFTDDKGLKTSYGIGLSVLPGLMLTDHSLAYGRLGVVRSKFSHQDLSRTGAQFGLGLQTCLTQNVDVRGEYDYVAYKTVSGSFLNKNSWSFTPRSDQVTVGFVYKFD